jgi:hypothetical protein
MNFLEICLRAKQECAISGTLSTVVNQTGELGRLVSWASSAYDDICARHDNWDFLRSAFIVSVDDGNQVFEITDCSDTRVVADEVGLADWWRDTFRIYLSSAGISTQTFLPFQEYASFRNYYLLGSPANQRPTCFTIRPDDDAIILGPTPDDLYVITGEYQIEASELNEDDDEPLFPIRYHMAIVYLAAQRYALYEQDAGMYDGVTRELNKLMNGLEFDQLPKMCIGPALA